MYSGPNAVFISGRKSIVIHSKINVFGRPGGDVPLFRWQGFDQRSRRGGVTQLDFEEPRKDVQPVRTYSPAIAPRCSN
jgi:hypothetical protein